MSDPLPIRDGVIPALDIEREMIDYLQSQMRQFNEGARQPATRICIALSGKGEDGRFHTRANSWDSREETTTMEHCGLAVMLFTQRALEP